LEKNCGEEGRGRNLEERKKKRVVWKREERKVVVER